MSQKVQSYEGEGRVRKPVYAPEGPASVASDPLGTIGATKAPAYYGDVPEALTGGAGPVERRKATPEELAAARAREDQPSHLTVPTLGKPVVFSPVARATPSPAVLDDPVRAAASRHRGGEANRIRIAAQAAAAPLEEEPTVTQEPHYAGAEPGMGIDWSLQVTRTEPRVVTLATLADAVGEAAEAWTDALQADHLADQARIRWQQARAALDAAYRALDNPPPAVEQDDDHEAAKARLINALREAAASAAKPEPEPSPIGGGPAPRRTVKEPRTEGLTDRQALAIKLLQSGLTRAQAARQMGTTYQTLDGLLESVIKKGLLPAELIPLLPARFAKYTGA